MKQLEPIPATGPFHGFNQQSWIWMFASDKRRDRDRDVFATTLCAGVRSAPSPESNHHALLGFTLTIRLVPGIGWTRANPIPIL